MSLPALRVWSCMCVESMSCLLIKKEEYATEVNCGLYNVLPAAFVASEVKLKSGMVPSSFASPRCAAAASVAARPCDTFVASAAAASTTAAAWLLLATRCWPLLTAEKLLLQVRPLVTGLLRLVGLSSACCNPPVLTAMLLLAGC